MTLQLVKQTRKNDTTYTKRPMQLDLSFTYKSKELHIPYYTKIFPITLEDFVEEVKDVFIVLFDENTIKAENILHKLYGELKEVPTLKLFYIQLFQEFLLLLGDDFLKTFDFI